MHYPNGHTGPQTFPGWDRHWNRSGLRDTPAYPGQLPFDTRWTDPVL